MMTKFGLSQNDYASIVRFAESNNYRTGIMRPGTVGIYYASESEMASLQFLDLSKARPGSFVTGSWGAFYRDGAAASSALHKTVNYAIVFFQANGSKEFTPVGAYELIRPISTPPPSTFENKKD